MGWVERFVAWAGSRSPLAPTEFHEATGLFTLSSVIGRAVYMQDGPSVIYPNVWPMLLGQSGMVKKSTTHGFAEDILNEAVKDLRMSDSATPEGLIAELSEKSGGGQCQVWTIMDEFGQVVSSMKHKEYMADIKDLLMKLYDGKPIQRRLAKVSYQMDPVYMTLLTATTESRLGQILKPEDLEDGFYPRFLIVRGTTDGWKPKPDWDDAMGIERDALVSDLKNLRLGYQNAITRMKFDDDAKQLYNNWCQDKYEEVKRGDFPGPVFSRLEDYFEKLAMLYELSEHMRPLGHLHLIPFERAVFVSEKIAKYAESAALMYERLGSNRYVERVFEIIAMRGLAGITYGELMRKTHFTAKRMVECLETLQQSQRVAQVEEGGGNARSRYFVRQLSAR